MGRRIIKRGYLQKVNRIGVSLLNVEKANRRWFQLIRDMDLLLLEYYDDAESVGRDHPTNCFNLIDSTFILRSLDATDSLAIHLPDRVITLRASTTPEIQSWETIINEYLRDLRHERSDNIYSDDTIPELRRTNGDNSTQNGVCPHEWDAVKPKKVELPEDEKSENCGNKKGATAVQENVYFWDPTEDVGQGICASAHNNSMDDDDFDPKQALKDEYYRGELPPLPPNHPQEENIYDTISMAQCTTALGIVEHVEKALEAAGDQEGLAKVVRSKSFVKKTTRVDEIDDDVYGFLVDKMKELEDWKCVGTMRAQRQQSVSNVYKPNPSPPPFNWIETPIEISRFYSSKKANNFGAVRSNADTQKDCEKSKGQLSIRPGTGDEEVSPTVGAIQALKAQIMNPGGLVTRLSIENMKKGVAFVNVGTEVFVAGWNTKITLLHNIFHIGDQIVGIDEIEVTDYRCLVKALDAVHGTDCIVRLRRMPHAKAFVVRRDVAGQSLGIRIHDGSNRIAVVLPDSLADAHGLPCYARDADGQPVMWTITEVNNRSVDLFYKDSEIQVLLNAYGMEISLVVQPSDFITQLKKQLKRASKYRNFVPS